MASKKYKLLLGLIALTASTAFAQMGKSYSVFDSSVVPSKRLPQQNEFWNNTYNFPAKPRNMLEVGASIGALTISGDVESKFPTPGFEVHLRKALGYVFSLRLQYMNGVAKGQSWLPSGNFAKNQAWTSTGYGAPQRTASGDIVSTLGPGGALNTVFYNYKTNVQDLSIQGIVTLNNIRFHKQKSGITIYAGGGVGATAFHAKVNALNDGNGGGTYAALYNSVVAQYGPSGGFVQDNKKDILKTIKDGLDNTYETEAESEAGSRRGKLGKNTLKPSGTFLFGISYKLSNRINIALEDRHTIVKTDLLDGQRWQENGFGDAPLTSDYDSYNFLSLGVNFNLGAKSVEPLWWLNPLDYAYSELNNPKHMKLPKPILDDTDGDGVTDQLDREPNTPAGCPVDSHGVTKDTDGDGVPDCKDKQLITPTECQPVDADGVGKCPPPPCCQAIMDTLAAGGGLKGACATDYPSLSVKGAALSADAKALLASVASKLKDKPTCTITLVAYPGASKAQQSLADRKLAAVTKYLVEKQGISADRIMTDKRIDGGDANTIDIMSN